jgi:hypothetical protein
VGPVLGGALRPRSDYSVAADIPGPRHPPVAEGPPVRRGPPVAYYEYGPPPLGLYSPQPYVVAPYRYGYYGRLPWGAEFEGWRRW